MREGISSEEKKGSYPNANRYLKGKRRENGIALAAQAEQILPQIKKRGQGL